MPQISYSEKGSTTVNPSIVTDGLLFYLDPNNRRCLDNDGKVYTDLIKLYSNVPDLSAGTLFSNNNSIIKENIRTFIELANSNILYGNVGPNNALSALSNYTLQFWFKNNLPTLSFNNNILTNNTATKINVTSNTVLVSSNFPYSKSSKDFNPYGLYTYQGTKNNKPFYTLYKLQPDFSNLMYTLEWNVSGSYNRWVVRMPPQTSVQFESIEDVDFPQLAAVTSWKPVLTAFSLDTGDMPNNFFGNSPGRVLDTFYHYSSSAIASVYYTRPGAINGSTYLYNFNFPRILRVGNTSWNLSIRQSSDTYSPLFSAAYSFFPWQNLYTFNTRFTALSCSTNTNLNAGVLSGGWISNSIGETINGRVWYQKDMSFDGATFDTPFGDMAFYIQDEIFPGSLPGWYVGAEKLNYTGSFVISSNETVQNPWEVNNWTVNKNFDNNPDAYFKISLYNPPTLTAVPIYPEQFSNVTIIISAGAKVDFDRGIFLSGGKTLNFAFSGETFIFNNTAFNVNFNEWNLVTLTKSGNVLTLYKNGISQSMTIGLNYNLSNFIFSSDITLGQLLLYDRSLSLKEVKSNYDNFKSRYNADHIF